MKLNTHNILSNYNFRNFPVFCNLTDLFPYNILSLTLEVYTLETYKSCSPMNNFRNMNQRSNYGRPMNNMHNGYGRPMSRPSSNDNCNKYPVNQSCDNSCSDNSHSHHHHHGSDCDSNHNHSSDCNHNSNCNEKSHVINAITNLINSSDDCKDNKPRLLGMPLASAFVPTQPWCKLYDKKEAICQGTAFPNLNLIFCGSRGRM